MCLPKDLADFHSVRFNLSVAGFDYIKIVERLVRNNKSFFFEFLFVFKIIL